MRSLFISLALLCLPAHAQENELDELLNELDSEAVEGTESGQAETRSPADQAPVQRPLSRPDKPQLEEIIVTAQKREESLQDTPISLAAFGTAQLETMGVEGLNDLSGLVPGLTVEPFPTSNATLRLYIRGIGIIDSQITQDPAIGVYYDGVYVARSVGNSLDIADIERIEVLRGPQGTLYGRNTTGGAINIITKKPSLDGFSMHHKLSAGERGRRLAKSAFNIPLTDSVAIKAAVLHTADDGFVENSGPGGDFGERESTAQRFDLRWLMGEHWTLDYGYDRAEIDHYNALYQAQLTPEGDKGDAELIKRGGQARSRFSDERLESLATGAPLEESAVDIRGHAITLTGDFDPFQIKYLGSTRELSDAFYTDLGGGAGSTEYRLDTNRYAGPAALVANGGPVAGIIPLIAQEQTTQELQLTGSGLWDSVDFIVGLYDFEESAVEDWPYHHQLSAPISPEQLPLDLAQMLGIGPRLVAFARRLNVIENQARAIYGQATWTPPWRDRRLHLTLGYRHSADERFAAKTFFSENYVEIATSDGLGLGLPLGLPNFLPPNPTLDEVNPLAGERFDNVQGKLKFRNDSWAFISEYDLAPNLNLYAKYVEAYKSGGFNVRDPQVSGDSGAASDGNVYGFGFREGFDPEFVTTLETGIKSELFDRRLRLNADVFYTEYEDMQINFLILGTVFDTKTDNVGKAEMRGLELDATWLATSDLLFSLSYAWLDAEITEVIDVQGRNVAEQFQFNSAPEHSASLMADWAFYRGGWGDARLNLAWSYTDERAGGARVGQPVSLPAYELLNLRLSLERIRLAGGEFKLALWGRNILDEVYEINAIDNLPHADRAVLWGEPRMVGMDLIYDFGT